MIELPMWTGGRGLRWKDLSTDGVPEYLVARDMRWDVDDAPA